MCGRYTLTVDPADLAEQFGLLPSAELDALQPRFNIAPTQAAAVIRDDLPGVLSLARWGLVPVWAKDPSIGAQMINARAETLAEKPAFRAAYKSRRCLVLADGFYEWKKSAGSSSKQPMYLRLKSGKPFAMAGLWERWKAPNDEWLVSCTIITVGPNELVAQIHNRMPAILPSGAEAVWLDRHAGQAELAQVLHGIASEAMEARPVSARVNAYRNDDATLIEPVPALF